MPPKKPAAKSQKKSAQAIEEIDELRAQLAEAQDTLRAIREGEVDALVVSGPQGEEQIFSLVGADSVYRLIVETMKEAAFTLTFDGTILFCNAQFSKFLKRPLEQIVGHRMQEFVAPDNHAAADALLIISQRQPVKQRLVLRDSNDQWVPVHVSANLLSQPDGISICIVATDLTDLENSTEMIQKLRRQQEALQAANEELAAAEEELRVQNDELATSRAELDQTRARYEDLFETAPDGYIGTDAEGIIQQANQAAVKLLGRTAAELLGNPFSALLPMSERNAYLQLLTTLSAEQTPSPKWETELRPLQGEPFWAGITAAASRDEEGNIVGLRWLVRDFTDRREAELAIHRQNAVLEGITTVLSATLTSQTEQELGLACLQVAEKITQSRFGFIGQTNENGLEDVAISNHGRDACNILDDQGHRVPLGSLKIHGIYGRVLADGKSLLTNDPPSHPDRIGLPAGHPSVESFLGVPLIRQGKTVGMIAVGNRPGGYTAADQEALEALAPAVVEAFLRKRAEQALSESEQRFRTMAESIPQLAWMAKPDGFIFWYNRRWYEYTGTTPHQMEGWGWQSVHDPNMLPQVLERWKASIASGEPFEMVFPLRAADGQFRLFLTRGQPLKDAQGQVVQWFGTNTDVNELKRAEEVAARLGAIVESSADAILSKDLEGTILTWNAAAERMFGYRAEEIVGQPITRILPPERIEEERQIMHRLVHGEGVEHFETVRLTKDGRQLEVSVTISPLRDSNGRVVGASKIIHDIAERKRTEEMLRHTTQELERSNKDLEQFAYVASHDMKEPLRMVSGFLKLLHDRYKGQLDATAQQWVTFAVDGANRMDSLIGDLLEYSRVGTGGGAPAPVDLAGIVEYVKGNLRTTIDESSALIMADLLPTVMADPAQMRQLFQNLIGNALKFHAKGRQPEVHISAMQDNGYWKVQIKDNGIGIDPKHAEKVFNVFQRLHTKEKYSGSGIGLAICKKIVERHGGRIWVESEPGKGSTFCFTIPAPH